MNAPPGLGGGLVIASNNNGKVREIARLLDPHGVAVKPVSAYTDDVPEETGTTFRHNAVLKARAAIQASGLPALADDSGLEVDALDGAPGIRSARWAGPGRDFSHAMDRLANLLEHEPGPSARFVCALALAWPDGTLVTVEGKVEGTLVFPPRGTRGFGYDPIFLPRGHGRTFGEMDPVEKEAISHRGEAFQKLVRACFRQ